MKNVPAIEQQAYRAERDRFTKGLAARISRGFAVGGRSNQIAKANLSFAEASTGVASREVQRLIRDIAVAIDQGLNENAGRVSVWQVQFLGNWSLSLILSAGFELIHGAESFYFPTEFQAFP